MAAMDCVALDDYFLLVGRTAREAHYAKTIGGAGVNDDVTREPIYAGELHASGPRKKRRRRRSPWIGFVAIMTFVGAILGVLIVLGLRFADGPATGVTLNANVVASPSVSPSPGSGLALLDAAYFSMKYPASFDTVTHLPDDKIFFEKYNLSSQKNYKALTTVTLHHMEYGLDDESDFKSRQLRHFQAVTDKLA